MPCLNKHGDFIVHFSINISSHPQLMRSMVSSTRKISAPFSSSSFPAFMATPMTAPSSAQGAGETGAADRLAARRRFSLFFTGQAPLVICAARVRSDPPAGARKNTGILPSLTRCVNSSRCLPSGLFYDLLRTDLDILSYLLYNPS